MFQYPYNSYEHGRLGCFLSYLAIFVLNILGGGEAKIPDRDFYRLFSSSGWCDIIAKQFARTNEKGRWVMLTTELFDHENWPGWDGQLDMLAVLVLPEPWRYRARTRGYWRNPPHHCGRRGLVSVPEERQNQDRKSILEEWMEKCFRSVACPECRAHMFYERMNMATEIVHITDDLLPSADQYDYCELCWRCKSLVGLRTTA